MKPIAYYITAHGYGHGARSCDILNALRKKAPDTRIIVKTDLPDAFLTSRLSGAFELRKGAFDVGLIQQDSIRVDLDASLQALQVLQAREPELLRQEMTFLKRESVGAVVADIPAIPLEAAIRCGLPAIATGNFGWDWIYEEFAQTDPRWQPIVESFRSVYARTDLLLRQPFAEPMESFPNRIDLPLLAQPGCPLRETIAAATGADPKRPWILLSFTSLALESDALERLGRREDVEWFSVEPLEWPASRVHCIRRSTARFADIMASVDIVVSKPGFGIISECMANDKPLIYTDRADFREYAVLVRDIKRYCRHVFLPNEELYAGRLDQALQALASAPPPPQTLPRGGGDLAAKLILEQAEPQP